MAFSIKNSDMCPLCSSYSTAFFWEGSHPKRMYLECRNCALVYVPVMFHLCPEEEKKIYDQHQNNPDDIYYRQFLSKLGNPLLNMLEPRSIGLDFGCGPGPTLSLIMEEEGHACAVFDKHYANDRDALCQQYDFITSTEVVEHLSEPGEVFDLLFSILKPTGLLGIMTKLVPTDRDFSAWHYKNDPTHIAFYQRMTMNYIAERYGRTLSIIGDDVIIFSP